MSESIVKYFELFSNEDCDGLENIFSSAGKPEVFKRLETIDADPLSKVQLNQLLIVSGLPGLSFGFFKYYWLTKPEKHTYDVTKLEDFEAPFIQKNEIISLQHLRWGLRRLYTDALLYFGNITNGYTKLSTKKFEDLQEYFEHKRFKTETIVGRGRALKFEYIEKEDRFLISEMACKTYEAPADSELDIKNFLIEKYEDAVRAGRKRITGEELFSKEFKADKKYDDNVTLFEFSAVDLYDKVIENKADIETFCSEVAKRFSDARTKALQNTKYYLSLVNDLDVYVATSMRGKPDFMEMANTCEKIFKDPKIKDYHLRFFDPTISAALGHEDKGLIECLMVRCAKVLIYSAGLKESYGKDAEAAMALSSGKPVIFYCIDSDRAAFYKKVHPLTKLIDFSSGVANGAMVTFQFQEVVELLRRLVENAMEYKIEQPKKGYFRLVEVTTDSAVRVQTNDLLLSKSFWNYFERFVN